MSTPRAQGPAASSYDIVIVGSGAGGGSLAHALAGSGLQILLVERGDFLPQEPENWDPKAVFRHKRYVNAEQWTDDRTGSRFTPGTYYYVGGNTKLYGASLVRFRREDFQEQQLAEGVSPAWPFGYEEIVPYYRQAEQLYRVHGADDDPTLSRVDDPYPYPPVEHEGTVAEIARDMRGIGLTPSHLSLGVDLRDGGRCIKCATCDAFPCRTLAKSDTDAVCVRPAMATGSVELLTGAYVERVLTAPGGRRAGGIQVVVGGIRTEITARTVVVSGGAVNSAALLLRSATEEHPDGLANSSGAVGRNYMVHNNTVMVGVHPTRKNTAEFQKTLYFNDFYTRGTPEHPFPLGHVQMIGKLQGEMLKGNRPELPRWALSMAAQRSSDWWLFSEDLPDPDNRVLLGDDGDIRIRWAPNNESTHDVLVTEMRKILRKIGYPFVFSQRTTIEVNSHQAGTVRAGTDPATSVLDPDCRAHDVENLYVVDSSFFPSLPVMNPALTIVANALRVADRIRADHAAGRATEPASV